MTSSGRGLIRMDLAIHSAAAARFPCRNDRWICPQCSIYGAYLRSSWRNTTSPECGSSLEDRSQYVDQLARRIYRAIGYGRLELRNAHGFVVPPPDHAVLKAPTLLQLKTWFETTYIRQGDYKRFCDDEDIPDALADREEVHDVWSYHSQGEDAIAEEPETAVASNVAEGDDAKEVLAEELVATPSVAQKPETVMVQNVAEGDEATEALSEELPATPAVEECLLLNYKQLASVFRVKNAEDDNLKWFEERCSSHGRYRGFSAALAIKGKRGPGNPSRFNILLIAAYLHEHEKIALNMLRSSIKNKWPLAHARFDELFGYDS